MKLIHTSDWHLGQRFYTYDRNDITHREHDAFIWQLCKIIQQHHPDALLVSGDIFDNIAPSNALRTRFVEYVMQLHDSSPSSAIVITAGNHDSGSLLDIEKKLWRYHNVHVFGTCQRHANGSFDPTQFIVQLEGKGNVVATPYFYLSNYPAATEGLPAAERPQTFYQLLLDEVLKHNEAQLPVVLMAHLAIQGCNTRGHEESIGRIETLPPSLLGQGYDYAALGHIHKPQTLTPGGKGIIRYCGSPIPLSFTEDYQHSVSLVEIASHNSDPIITELPITPLRQMLTLQSNSLDEGIVMLEKLSSEEHSYVRLLVNTNELLPPNANDRARKVSEGRAWNFCEVRAIQRDEEKTRKETAQATGLADIHQIQQLHPMEIAKEYMQRIGKTLSDTQYMLLNEAVESARHPKEAQKGEEQHEN